MDAANSYWFPVMHDRNQTIGDNYPLVWTIQSPYGFCLETEMGKVRNFRSARAAYKEAARLNKIIAKESEK